MNCVYCGQKFTADKCHPYMKYCSSKCSEKANEERQRELLTDRIVKRHLYVGSKGKIKYAEMTPVMIIDKRQSILKARKHKEHLKLIPPKPTYPKIKICVVCDKAFETSQQNAKHCSIKCSMHTHLSNMRDKYRDKWQPPPPFMCRECGKTVTIKFGNKRDSYCSEECMSKSVKRNISAKRRMRMVGGYIEQVSVTYIYNRDKGRCHICRKHININLKHPHPMSMTLDHIIPIAKGGTHERKNIKAAHMICNSTKRDLASGHGDQTLLFG